jgi:tRNA(fMet)-specific endonuclease VapC
MTYLLDTNILIYHLNNRYGISDKIREIGFSNCLISEITILELLYGVASGSASKREANLQNVRQIEILFADRILPIRTCFEEFAKQKTSLRQQGKLISDFDLLIGCTALVRGCPLVSLNTKEMLRIDGLHVENWVSI